MWQEEAVQLVVDLMDEYSLNQEDVDTIHEISKFKVCLDTTLKFIRVILYSMGLFVRSWSLTISIGGFATIPRISFHMWCMLEAVFELE